MVLIEGDRVFLQLVEFGSFALGWFSKGLGLAVASEIVFRPIARRIKKKVIALEQTDPLTHALILHHWHNHPIDFHGCSLCHPSL